MRRHPARKGRRRRISAFAVGVLVLMCSTLATMGYAPGVAALPPPEKIVVATPRVDDLQDLRAELQRLRARPVPVVPALPRLVALTFDDGPSEFTQQVVAILQQKQVTGTFFFIGRSIGGFPGIVARLRDQGFEVESHTWNHPDLTRLTSAGILRQIKMTNAVLGSTEYVRPPLCRFDSRVISVVHSAGLKLALWNVDTLDWRRDTQSILSHVKAETRPGYVVLMHDGGGDRSQTVAALPLVIDWLKSQGYTLVRLDQLGTAGRRGTLR